MENVKNTAKLINDRIYQAEKIKNSLKKIVNDINSQIETKSEAGYLYLEIKYSNVMLTIPELGISYNENINDLIIKSQSEGVKHYILKKINNMLNEVH